MCTFVVAKASLETYIHYVYFALCRQPYIMYWMMRSLVTNSGVERETIKVTRPRRISDSFPPPDQTRSVLALRLDTDEFKLFQIVLNKNQETYTQILRLTRAGPLEE